VSTAEKAQGKSPPFSANGSQKAIGGRQPNLEPDLRGRLSFTGPKKTMRVRIGQDGNAARLFAERIFHQCWRAPSVPQAKERACGRTIVSIATYDHGNWDAVPEHVLVLGGGYVGPGIVGAQLFPAGLGSEVTVRAVPAAHKLVTKIAGCRRRSGVHPESRETGGKLCWIAERARCPRPAQHIQ